MVYLVQIKETLPCYLFSPCLFEIHTISYIIFVTAGGIRDRTTSGSGICIHGFGGDQELEQELREDHQRRCLQQNPEVRDTGIHLKVDEEQRRIAQGSKRQASGYGPHC